MQTNNNYRKYNSFVLVYIACRLVVNSGAQQEFEANLELRYGAHTLIDRDHKICISDDPKGGIAKQSDFRIAYSTYMLLVGYVVAWWYCCREHLPTRR